MFSRKHMLKEAGIMSKYQSLLGYTGALDTYKTAKPNIDRLWASFKPV